VQRPARMAGSGPAAGRPAGPAAALASAEAAGPPTPPRGWRSRDASRRQAAGSLDGGEQGVEVERLAEEAGELQHLRLLLEAVVAGERDDRDVGDPPVDELERPELPAGRARHVEVEQHEARSEPRP